MPMVRFVWQLEDKKKMSPPKKPKMIQSYETQKGKAAITKIFGMW